jgi:hypothetical protein
MGRLLFMKRTGIGGVVKVGYMVCANITKWEYVPEGAHSQWPEGSGVVTVEMDVIDPTWFSPQESFTLELVNATGGRMKWPKVEMVSDCCFAVPGFPEETQG